MDVETIDHYVSIVLVIVVSAAVCKCAVCSVKLAFIQNKICCMKLKELDTQ